MNAFEAHVLVGPRHRGYVVNAFSLSSVPRGSGNHMNNALNCHVHCWPVVHILYFDPYFYGSFLCLSLLLWVYVGFVVVVFLFVCLFCFVCLFLISRTLHSTYHHCWRLSKLPKPVNQSDVIWHHDIDSLQESGVSWKGVWWSNLRWRERSVANVGLWFDGKHGKELWEVGQSGCGPFSTWESLSGNRRIFLKTGVIAGGWGGGGEGGGACITYYCAATRRIEHITIREERAPVPHSHRVPANGVFEVTGHGYFVIDVTGHLGGMLTPKGVVWKLISFNVRMTLIFLTSLWSLIMVD